MREHKKRDMPRLDNLAFVTTFPKDYLPYAQQKRKSDPMESNPHWKYKRKRWCWPFRKCCNLSSATTIISITVTILAFMAALGVSIYFGVLTTMYTSPVFHIYGKIRVTEGDEFDSSLLDANSANFASKAAIYENKIRSTYLRSFFQYTLHEVRIYGFREPGLNIFFRLHLDRRKRAEIQGINNMARTVLLNEIKNGNIFEGLSIDPESVSFSDTSCLDDCPTQAPAASANTTAPLSVSDWLNTIDVTTKQFEQDELSNISTNKNEIVGQVVTPINAELTNVTSIQVDVKIASPSWKNISELGNTSAKYNDTGVTVSSPKFVSQFTNREENGIIHQEIDKQEWNGSITEDDLIVPVSDTSPSSTIDSWNDEFDVVTMKDVQNEFPECGKDGYRCADNKCIPGYRRCDRFSDCLDDSDEANCTCSDYLRSLDQPRKICDGFVDCWDYSDETKCPWCSDDMFHCPGAKVCINKTKVCDGIRDCPSGSDESVCMKVAKDERGANGFTFAKEGYLMIQREGRWKKLCLDNNNLIEKARWNVEQLGHTVCSTLTYENLESIVLSPREYQENSYYELIPATERSGTTFLTSDCIDGKIARIKCRNLECGLGSHIRLPTKRIVGGESAALGSRPWLAALYREGQFQCGAIVIADRWILSAGHCFYHTRLSYWVARMGFLRRGTDIPTPYEIVRRIIQINVNPQYINKNFLNDIAVLKLESAVPFSNYIRPICLPQPEDDVTKWNGKRCSVVGWGKLGEHGDEFPDTLQEVQLPVISTEECRKRTLFLPIYQITDNMFCAGYERGGRDACLGDSGGPMMCQKEDGRWVLIGIISNGDGCARASRPGVYTKVGNFINWIGSVMNDNTTDEVKPDNCLGTRCQLGMCLPSSANCDGTADCPDGSDERGC